jgi:hypothetical protein
LRFAGRCQLQVLVAFCAYLSFSCSCWSRFVFLELVALPTVEALGCFKLEMAFCLYAFVCYSLLCGVGTELCNFIALLITFGLCPWWKNGAKCII